MDRTQESVRDAARALMEALLRAGVQFTVRQEGARFPISAKGNVWVDCIAPETPYECATIVVYNLDTGKEGRGSYWPLGRPYAAVHAIDHKRDDVPQMPQLPTLQ